MRKHYIGLAVILVIVGASCAWRSKGNEPPILSVRSNSWNLLCAHLNGSYPATNLEILRTDGISGGNVMLPQARSAVRTAQTLCDALGAPYGSDDSVFFDELEELSRGHNQAAWETWLGKHEQVKGLARRLFSEAPDLLCLQEDRSIFNLSLKRYGQNGPYGMVIRFTAGVRVEEGPLRDGFWIRKCDQDEMVVDYEGRWYESNAIRGTLIFAKPVSDTPHQEIVANEMRFIFN